MSSEHPRCPATPFKLLFILVECSVDFLRLIMCLLIHQGKFLACRGMDSGNCRTSRDTDVMPIARNTIKRLDGLRLDLVYVPRLLVA